MNKPIIDTSIKIVDSMPPSPDYKSFVDDDIRAMFDGKGGYFLQDILMAQLIKELRRLNEVRK